ncbi:restriction endonuclease subunit S [Shewanella decolorationis]|uniref:Restriction endonuclease subunit S n=1 Tax=Shewanella decolorationis TaxID=256839 RepID=A0A5B8QWZ3_9GAMM|nr:restriction endonuclease subunit S [Shewanella decolorationis]QDZ90855.1 restriction endonuclease subunit S [Shewanella decolorationis]
MINIAEMPKYQTYKDSTEGWIGDVPEHWDIRKLKHLFYEKKHRPNMSLNCGAISFGKVVTKDDEKILLTTKVSYQEVLSGEFLINPLNLNYDLVSLRIALSEIDVVVSAGYIVIKEKEELHKQYFKYLLHRYDVAYMKLLGSGVRQTISFNHIANSLLVFPPLEEQTRIANFLDKKITQIDDAIAIKEQQISLLKERKQIIIQQAVTQGLDPNVPLKESGIIGVGRVPEHWDIVFNRRVFRENSRKVKGDELPLSLSQVDGVIPSNDMKERSLSPSHRNNFKLCFPGDLVVNRFKGHLGVFFNSEYEGIVTFHYGVFEPQKGVHTKFFEHLYHAEPYKAIYAGASNGMTVGLQNLSNQNFYMIKTIRPPEKEQVEICRYIEKISNEINIAIGGIELQIEKLKEYKTTLINSAVTGKIKITPQMIEQ